MTFDTVWRILIFWSPNFYTITETSALKFLSLGLMFYMVIYKILRVRPTIFGLESLRSLVNCGKICLNVA